MISAFQSEYRQQYADNTDADADRAIHKVANESYGASDEKEEQCAHALENSTEYQEITTINSCSINIYLCISKKDVHK